MAKKKNLAQFLPQPMKRFREFFKTLYQYRFTFLLIALLLDLVLPSLLEESANNALLLQAARTLLLIACLNILQKRRHLLVIIGIIGFLATSADWISQDLIGFLLFTLFIGIITYDLFSQIMKVKEITLQIIIAALNGYLLLGFIGSTMFFVIHIIYPESFTHVAEGEAGFKDLVYFSYITLTTIGYGDIIPLHDGAKRVAVLLGLLGQFYLAVVMAVLVGKYLSRPEHR